MPSPSLYNGIVVVDKPAGMTSHDVVGVARKLFKTKRVGHTGTLDPEATGVLVLCLGQATRLAEYLSAARKHYVTEVVFGIETDTQDATGVTLAERDAAHLTEDTVQALLPRFRGAIQQIPPMVSALHHQGKRLYELAREGVEVERAPRDITIYALELVAFTAGVHPVGRLEVTCSTGTYIRTLAADLGAAAGTGGMMRALRRTWVGQSAEKAFTLQEAQTLDGLRERAGNGTLGEIVLPLALAVRDWATVTLDPAQQARIRNGQRLVMDEIEIRRNESGENAPASLSEDERLLLLDEAGEVCAVARACAAEIQPEKVFVA